MIIRRKWRFSLVYIIISIFIRATASADSSSFFEFKIQMRGYSPVKSNDYVTTALKAVPGFVTGFVPLATADRVHHIILYGCSRPAKNTSFWRGREICGSGGVPHILYAWARNGDIRPTWRAGGWTIAAPRFELPTDVGFSVGHEGDPIQYFVLQIHYTAPFAGNVKDYSGLLLYMTKNSPSKLAGVLLMASTDSIPPNKRHYQTNITCVYKEKTTLYPFAFRTHTHAMGRVVSAYYQHNGKWNKIGRRNPQWPQSFISIYSTPTIRNGDVLAASCRYDSHDKNDVTLMGESGDYEMCNFYMMYAWNANELTPFQNGGECFKHERKEAMSTYPAEGMELLPAHPELENHARPSSVPFGVVEVASFTQIGPITLGEISGLTFDREGTMILFHRGTRVWDETTFDKNNNLIDKTPIAEDTILFIRFDGDSPKLLKTMGAKKFFVPQGIHLGEDGFLYTTDVGTHTVAMWNISGNSLELLWERGERFIPGSGDNRLCKPTGIVRAGNNIYVADGLCNNRIVEFSLEGKKTNEFAPERGTKKNELNVPFDVSVSAKMGLFISDRENGRVTKVAATGALIKEYSSEMFDNVYSADVNADFVYLIPGRKSTSGEGVGKEIEVYMSRQTTGIMEFSFAPTGRPFQRPQVLRSNLAGDTIFVADIIDGKGVLRKFDINREDGHKPSSALSQKDDSSALLFWASVFLLLSLFFWILWRKLYKRNTTNVRRIREKTFKRLPLRMEDEKIFISDSSDSD